MAQRPIQVLPAAVVAKIAAGEVIGRPSAAVKELLDNALDSGAAHIDVEIVSGGYDLIAVHDDGCGIPAADAALVFTRHATSKLAGPDDLAGIATLGFRGEALASLAAVAEVRVRTRQPGAPAGTSIHVAPDGELDIRPVARQPGTSVEAWGLFHRYPVRRNAADPIAETAAIRRLVGQLALIHTGVEFTLLADERPLLRTAGRSARVVFGQVHGDDALSHLLDFGPLEAAGATIAGLVSGPGAHRGRRDELVLGVNGRLCGVAELLAAVERAYADVLPRRRYPYAVLRVELPPERVDANVHPAKERVTLRDTRRLAEALERELRALLGRTTYRISERRRLALEAADLPGLRAAERGAGYATGPGWGGRDVEAGSLPRLRVVGQIEDTLIVCESELGTLLVDQHRAHERVIYERLLTSESVTHDPPWIVRLSPSAATRLADHYDELAATGWRVDLHDAERALVHAAPPDFTPGDLEAVVSRFMLEDSATILAAAACHAAIRKRRPLTPEAAVELLEALTATPMPATCPHGQPIVIRLDHDFLERQFGWR
jgi:DNA mismatch repair protein MutL